MEAEHEERYNMTGQWTTNAYGWREEKDAPRSEKTSTSVLSWVFQDQIDSHAADNGPRQTGEYSNKVFLCNAPFYGRMHFLKDIKGIISLSFIYLYWIYGNWSTWTIVLLPQYADGAVPLILLLWYGVISILTLTSLTRACSTNPGRIPYSEDKAMTPKDDSGWTMCRVCQRKRPPRAHHCSRCKQCVMRMDHHCPWVNNCVGLENHFAFIQLIFYAVLLSLTTLIIDVIVLWYQPACDSCDMSTFAMRHKKALLITGLVMAIMMTLGTGGLVATQHFSVIMDMTTIDWMKLQQDMQNSKQWTWPEQSPFRKRSFVQAYRDLCGPGSLLLWPFPCRKRRSSPIFRTSDHIV